MPMRISHVYITFFFFFQVARPQKRKKKESWCHKCEQVSFTEVSTNKWKKIKISSDRWTSCLSPCRRKVGTWELKGFWSRSPSNSTLHPIEVLWHSAGQTMRLADDLSIAEYKASTGKNELSHYSTFKPNLQNMHQRIGFRKAKANIRGLLSELEKGCTHAMTKACIKGVGARPYTQQMFSLPSNTDNGEQPRPSVTVQ